jgi:DNA-binding protein H-NS
MERGNLAMSLRYFGGVGVVPQGVRASRLSGLEQGTFNGDQNRGNLMESKQLQSMSTDELWDLYEKVDSTLADKLQAEKAKIEERLRRLEGQVRRPYPPVHPKYKNPRNPTEIWSGRGKQPLWVREQLRAGKKLDQFLIAESRRRSRAEG